MTPVVGAVIVTAQVPDPGKVIFALAPLFQFMVTALLDTIGVCIVKPTVAVLDTEAADTVPLNVGLAIGASALRKNAGAVAKTVLVPDAKVAAVVPPALEAIIVVRASVSGLPDATVPMPISQFPELSVTQ